MRRLAALGVLAAGLLFAGQAWAATYYVSPSGSDSAAGTSPSTAWKTVARVNRQSLAPGDTVLFDGAATFADTTLMPSGSGTASAPITFSSYGPGRATIANAKGAVWFSGASWLVFDRLDLTTNDSATGVFAGSGGAGSSHITLSDSTVENTAGPGVIAPNPADSSWSITNDVVSHTGDSGLIMFGSGHTISHDTISDTGWNTSLGYGTHGIYAKGADQTISYNDISHDRNGQAVSIRFHGARVFGNAVHDTPAGIGFFDYDTAPAPQGTSYVYDNRFWNLSDWGLYYDDQADPNGHAPTVSLVVDSNTWSFASASEAVNVSRSGSAGVTLVNNVFEGSYGSGLRAAPTTTESHNLWFGGSSNVPSGKGDVHANPQLTSAPDFAPLPGSPVIDAGTTAGTGLVYASACDASPLGFCGGTPDLGAIESAGTAAAAAPQASGSPAPASAVAPPTVRLTSPASGAVVPLRFTVTAAASGGAAARMTFLVDGEAACTVTKAPYSCGVTVAAGKHRLQAVAVEPSGSVASPAVTETARKHVVVNGLAILPGNGASVAAHFTLVAHAPASTRAVAFVLDGRTACVVRRAPFSCSLHARKGWHQVSVRAAGSARTLVRLRVAH